MDKIKKGRILIVDDEIEVLNPLCDFLTELGYEVVAYTSGKEAIEALKRQEFELFITDLVLPEIDGIALIKTALEIAPILVGIVITGRGTIETAVEAMKIGAFDYLLKPLEWKTLSLILSRAMKVCRLREAEEKYRSIVEDYQTELICRFLPNCILTFVNNAYCRYFNKRPEELIGWSFLLSIPEEDRNMIKEHLASINYKNPISSLEYRVINPDENICWQHWTNRAIFDKYGNVTEFQSIGRDVTDRKRAERALQESEEKYRSLVNNANEAIIVAQDSFFKFINPMVCKITGYSYKELTAVPFTHFVHPDDRDKVFNNYLKRLKCEKISDIYSFKLIDKNGNIKWVELSAVLLTWEGRPATLNFLTDITKRKQAEEELNQSYRQLCTLAARLAEVEEAEKQKLTRELHDQVGQDLTALGINLNIMRSQIPANTDKSFLSRLDDSLLLLEQTVERIRDVMSNLRPSVMDDYGLMAVLRWYGERFSKRTGLDLEIKGEDLVPRLHQNKELTMFRITQEALTNVAKHAKANKVIIQLGEINGLVQLVISDNGIGFEIGTEKLMGKQAWGLLTMQERAQTIDGVVYIKSEIGKGTNIVVEVPRL